MCRGRGRREKEENSEEAEAEAAESRKHFICPEVRFLAHKRLSGGSTGQVILTMGQLVSLSGFHRSTQHACGLVLHFLVEGLGW